MIRGLGHAVGSRGNIIHHRFSPCTRRRTTVADSLSSIRRTNSSAPRPPPSRDNNARARAALASLRRRRKGRPNERTPLGSLFLLRRSGCRVRVAPSRSSYRREEKSRAAAAPSSLILSSRTRSVCRLLETEQQPHAHAPYTRSSPCHFRRRPGRRDRLPALLPLGGGDNFSPGEENHTLREEEREFSLARATSASVQRRSYARACLSRDTSSGASSFGVLKRPSARRGPGIVSVDRNVRSKCRCSCVLQFTS